MSELTVKQALETDVDDATFYSEFSKKEEWDVTLAYEESGERKLFVPNGLRTTGVEPTYVSDYFRDNIARPVVNMAKPPNNHPHSTMMDLLKK